MLYLSSGSPQHLYQDMQMYVVIVLLDLYWSKKGENTIHISICIILLSITCRVYTREEIIPNPKFQYSGPLLVILSVSRNVDFGDTREVLLIGP